MKGEKITLTTDEKRANDGDASCIYVDYKNITKVLKPGGRIYIDDGLISVVADEIGKQTLIE